MTKARVIRTAPHDAASRRVDELKGDGIIPIGCVEERRPLVECPRF